MKTKRTFWVVGQLLVLGAVLSLVPGQPAQAVGADVLILDSTVRSGASSVEAVRAGALGLSVDIVTGAQWAAMSTADFAAYRAIILGDPDCRTGTSAIAPAMANASVWGAAVTGNVVIIGTDPVFHGIRGRIGGINLTEKGIAFAADALGKTGAYITLSCYFHGTGTMTPVSLLDAFEVGGFTVRGVGCFNNAHIVATHPSLDGLTDADLSNWSCSVHEAFDGWPADFAVLAMARGIGGSFTAVDGSVGTPYIVARGEGLTLIGDANPPICEVSVDDLTATGTATDNRPTEDTNGNGVLDAGEDLNGNDEIDEDQGIISIELVAGSINCLLSVDAFLPGDPVVGFTVTPDDPTLPAVCEIKAIDGALNPCNSVVTLGDFDPFGGIRTTPTRRVRTRLRRPSPDTDGARCVETTDPTDPDFTGVPFIPFTDSELEFDIDLSDGDGVKTVCCEFIDNAGVISPPFCTDIELDTGVLLVVLESFTAERVGGGFVVRWNTSAELDNAGFRVLRQFSAGPIEVVTPRMIPARGTELQGAEYSFVDLFRRGRGDVKYYLEDIDLRGEVTRHGPAVLEHGMFRRGSRLRSR